MRSSEAAAAEYGPGDIVVLSGLRDNPKHASSSLIGPKIGQIAKMLSGGRVFVRLHMGGAFSRSRHFSSKGRIAELVNIRRHATPREKILGEVIEQLVRAAS